MPGPGETVRSKIVLFFSFWSQTSNEGPFEEVACTVGPWRVRRGQTRRVEAGASRQGTW